MNLQFFSKYEKGPFVISGEMKLVEARMIETLRISSGRPVATVRAGGWASRREAVNLDD